MDKHEIENLLGADPKALTAKLSDSDRRLFEQLMSDPAARQKFLSSKEAAAIIQILNRGDKNGRS